MLTLLDCQNDSGLVNASGVCPTSTAFTDKVNAAQRRLMRRGDWFGTAVPIFVCVFQGCLVWPRYVLEVRRLNICHHAMPPRSLWYDFLPSNQRDGWGPRLPHQGLRMVGTSPVLQDVLGDGRLIRAYARCQQDLGKTITFFGIDNNGQPLITLDNAGNKVQDGLVLTLANPYASTSIYVRRIDYVMKQATQQIVDVYAYNAANNWLEEIAHYEPNELTPTYARYQIHGPWPNLPGQAGLPGCCTQPMGVTAMVKLRFIPAAAATDAVLIDNLDALKKMFFSLNREDAQDVAGAKEFESDAIHEMNRQLEDHLTDEQFVVEDGVVGARGWTNQCF